MILPRGLEPDLPCCQNPESIVTVAMRLIQAVNRWIRKRTSPEKSQGCAQRYFMGAADRNTREGSAAALSPVSNLPSIVPDLGPAEGIQTYLDRTWRGSAPTRGHRYSCNLYRWQFQPHKKRVILSALQSVAKVSALPSSTAQSPLQPIAQIDANPC